MTKRIQEIVKSIAEIEGGPQLLRDNPKELAKQLNLSSIEVAAIFSGDLQLVHKSNNPLAGTTTFTFVTGSTAGHQQQQLVRLGANSTTTFTFLTGSTITAELFGPTKLEELSQGELIRVLNKSLVDPDFADRVRRFVR